MFYLAIPERYIYKLAHLTQIRMLNMRPKKKESAIANKGVRDINQNSGDCSHYRRRLEEYRRGLYELGGTGMAGRGNSPGDGAECTDNDCETCDTNRDIENVNRRNNVDLHENLEDGNSRDPQQIRHSMHWEDFFGMV